ncbi:MAG: hypothetical protein AB7I27_19215 [Bacteriovoracaceae bacterium]
MKYDDESSDVEDKNETNSLIAAPTGQRDFFKIKHSLRRDIAITLRSKHSNKKQSFIDDLIEKAFKQVPQLRKAIKMHPVSVSNPLSRKEHIGFIGSIEERTSLIYANFEKPADNGALITGSIPYIQMKISSGGESIDCIAVCGRKRIEMIESCKGIANIYVAGVIVNLPIDNFKSVPTLYITQMHAVTEIRSYVPCSQRIKEEAEKILESENIFQEIRERVVKIVGFKGLDYSPILEKALDAVILQSISGDYFDNTTGKIHILLIGAPASGKKLISKVAEILNVTFQNVSSGKMTIPGISASTYLKDGRWISKPGALVLAHEGVVSCQDFHSVPKSILGPLMGIISDVTENGKFTDSSTSGVTHKACTGLLLDLNKQSDLSSKKVDSYQEDILWIPENILSRFDIIMEIEADAKRQLDVSLSMYSSSTSMPASKKDDEILILRYAVASLRDKFPKINFPSKSIKLLQRLHAELFKPSVGKWQNNKLSAYMARATNSALKFSSALARSDGRATVSEADVRTAFEIIQEKFKVISHIHPDSTSTERLQGDKPSKNEIIDWLCHHFPDGIKVSKAVNDYKDFFKTKQSSVAIKKLLYRIFEREAIQQEHGIFIMKKNVKMSK